MKATTQASLDKLSIGLSIVCALHCALVPIVLLLLPALSLVEVADSVFHVALLWIFVPVAGLLS